jgi:NADH dehydrogenase (ubiquinone) Fe-S protein 2
MCTFYKNNNINLIENLTINFGPQHPAAHGVLRLLLVLDGEIVRFIDPHIGLLHRGTEKLFEYKNIQQNLPYFDRFDYVSMMAQEHGYCLVVENLFDIKISLKSSYIRVLFLELTRILNHILALTTHALDVGALTPFLWGFEEREKIMEFYERVSGARMHASYIRPGGVAQDLPYSLILDISDFVKRAYLRFVEIFNLLKSNRIWLSRLVKVGIIDALIASQAGFSGVMLRGSGIFYDLRIHCPYEIYSNLDFKIPIGFIGDCYDRFLVRSFEIFESLYIVKQCLDFLKGCDENLAFNFKLQNPSKKSTKQTMEALIHHFKKATTNISLPDNYTYVAVEAPKGEFGVFIQGKDNVKVARCRIRAPGFFHLQGLHLLTLGSLLADTVTVIGTQDIVFGEIDR